MAAGCSSKEVVFRRVLSDEGYNCHRSAMDATGGATRKSIASESDRISCKTLPCSEIDMYYRK